MRIANTFFIRTAIALLTGGCIALFAQAVPSRDGISFERLTAEDGIYQSHITSLFQDRTGYLWIGTSDGLSRYDGYRVTTYRFDPLDSTSISGNVIESITEDRDGNLWVIASGGGINRFDAVNEQFRHFRHDPDRPGSLSSDDVTVVYADPHGNLWVGTDGGGLNLYDPAPGRFIRFRKDPDNSNSLSHNSVSRILADQRGNLWVGTRGGGLNRLSWPEGENPGTAAAPIAATLRFEHFHAQGPTYMPSVFAVIDSLRAAGRRLGHFLGPPNYQDTTIVFDVPRGGPLAVVGMGEGNAFGMQDYGWIEGVNMGPEVWRMNYEDSRHAGGATRNRIQINLVNLPAGRYQIRFRSDGRHDAGNWVAQPPGHPHLWGVQVLSIDATTHARLTALLKVQRVPNSLPHNWITDLYEDGDGLLWIGTADGLVRLEPEENGPGRFRVYQHDSDDPASLNHSSIRAIFDGGDPFAGHLWIRTAGSGLNRFDKRTGSAQLLPGPPSDAGGLSVTAQIRDSDGMLWVGTRGEGLYCIDIRDAEATPLSHRFRHEPRDLQSISQDDITVLFEDRSGILWVGTRRGGLNKVNRRHRKFRHITVDPDHPERLSHPVVNAILGDSAGLWIGTGGGGLNRLTRDPAAPTGYRYTHFRHDPGDSTSLSHDNVTALLPDPSGDLWVGTYGGGLNRMAADGSGFHHYRFNPNSGNSLSSDDINTLYEDQYGQMWIGTADGLTKFDRFTHTFTQYFYDPGDPYSLSHNEVWSIYEDSYSNGRTLWIGTRAGGLNKFERTTERFIRYTRDFDDPFSLNNPAILSIFQDSQGNLWFGTYSGGLNKFERDQEQFTFYTERDGLANNMIFGILEDDAANLWLSTNKGISKFDPRSGAVKNYDASDGLQANQFNAGAYWRGDDGTMYFGGVNGFNAFQPDSVRDNPHVPPVVITDMEILGESARTRLNRALTRGEPLVLEPEEDLFSLEFAVLDFTNPAKNATAYRMEGLEQGWINLGQRRFANFTNLDPGEYTFVVRGANNDGVWNEVGTALRIEIQPPFYRTWWFLLLSLGFLGGMAWLFHITRLRVNLNRLMEIEQVRRTESERVRAKAAHDFHDELGHKLTRISLFSELVKRQLNGQRSEVGDYLNRISNTAKDLSAGMKDFIWTLDPEKDSLHEVGVRLKDFGDELFDKTGIAFRVDGFGPETEAIRLSSDWRRHLTLIFKEAMNNALKHSGGGNVELSLTAEGMHVEITLSDDGVGPAGGHGEIHGDSGGQGRINMAARARRLGGVVTVEARPEGGTVVRFRGTVHQPAG